MKVGFCASVTVTSPSSEDGLVRAHPGHVVVVFFKSFFND